MSEGFKVNLILGINYNGNLYKEAYVDKLRGEDEENISDDEVKQNLGKVITVTLARCLLQLGDIDMAKVSMKSKIDLIRNTELANRNDLLIGIKEFTYGNEFAIEAVCRRCGKRTRREFNTNDIRISKVKEFDSMEVYELPDGYKDDKKLIHKKVKLKMLSGVAQEEISGKISENAGKALTLGHQRSVASIEGVDFLDSDVFNSLSRKDRLFLQDVYEKAYPGKLMWFDEKCPQCKADLRLQISVMDFLYPEAL